MKTRKIVLVAMVVCAGLVGVASQVGKKTVCHVPFGNPLQTLTLEVPDGGVQAHLDHGDYLGECKENPNSNHD